MIMSQFEIALFNSFEKSCNKHGLSLNYANKTYEIKYQGRPIFKGNILETQMFLKTYHPNIQEKQNATGIRTIHINRKSV